MLILASLSAGVGLSVVIVWVLGRLVLGGYDDSKTRVNGRLPRRVRLIAANVELW